jgi:serine protease Do
MRKLMFGGLAAVVLIVLVGLAGAGAWAQTRVPTAPAPPTMMLEGPGSGIGATVRDPRAEEITGAGLAQAGGALIEEVRDDGAAARAGLQKGDIVVEFDGERVRSARHFTRLVRETPPGRSVTSSVARDGSRRSINITPDTGDRFAMTLPEIGPAIERGLRALPRDFAFDIDPRDFDFDIDVPGPRLRGFARARMGITLAPLSDQLAQYFGVTDGALVSSVEPDSAAFRAGVRAGDVITAVNGRAVRDAGDVTRAVREAQDGATLDLRLSRDRKEIDVKVVLPARDRPRPPGVSPV